MAIKNDPNKLTLTDAERAEVLRICKVYAENCNTFIGTFRQFLLIRDKAYQGTLNQTTKHLEAVRRAMAGDTAKLQDLSVPIVMPAVESAVAYQAGVFLTSTPIFGVIASADKMPQAQKFEMALQKQSEQFGWTLELIKTFRKAMKYNFGPALVDWKVVGKQKIITSLDSKSLGQARTEANVVAGNQIKSLDPYNLIFDYRVLPSKLHTEGEFVGYSEVMSRIALKRYIAALDPTKTSKIREAFESSPEGDSTTNGALGYYVPQINPFMDLDNLRSKDNWLRWLDIERRGNNDINYKDNYLVTNMYIRACPSDFGSRGNIPNIYHLVIINWKVVVFAERVVAEHDYLPVVVMHPKDDDLGFQTKSGGDIAWPFQDMSSALWNIGIESQRRAIYDRLVYSPLHIEKTDIDPADAVSRIPLKNAGLASARMADIIHQIPYSGANAQLAIQQAQMIGAMADDAGGQNKVSRGQFQKGNKTTAEFEKTMDGSNQRSQLEALTIEAQFMTPVKEIIRSNTMMFGAPQTMLDRKTKTEVKIDPTDFRETLMEFTLTDGVLPMEKLINPAIMQVLLQTQQALPMLGAEYDILGMFIYWCQLQGANWLDDFKRSPEQQQNFMNMLQQQTNAQQSTADKKAALTQSATQSQQPITAQG